MNKIVFITGTSTGFGKLTATTLANAGYNVIAGIRGISGKNETVAKELGNLPNVEDLEIDVTDDSSEPMLLKKCFKSMAKLMYWSITLPFQASDYWKRIVWTESVKCLK